jgi:site-specific recombinase XerD
MLLGRSKNRYRLLRQIRTKGDTMNTELAVIHQSPLASIGHVANQYASQNIFADYHSRIAHNTLRRQRADLSLFTTYLAHAGLAVTTDSLMTIPDSWSGITFGLVEGYVKWMLSQGYAIDSINVRLATIKAYCKLVTKAGIIPTSDYALITLVSGYRHKEGRNIDQGRAVTRVGDKKAVAVSISHEQATCLKSQPGTPQGKRDVLLMCLLLDHGLRCGEVAALTPEAINLSEGTLTFYRQKVDKVQTHHLTHDSLLAAIRYLEIMPSSSPRLLSGSRKGGKLEGVMSERAITDRVCTLGTAIGLSGLSAHDCRHFWATSAIKGGTDIKSLQDAGGWSSPAMPLRYVESSAVANKGVVLG